jgi:hypothetical protein
VIIDSWLVKLPENITGRSKIFMGRLRELLDTFIEPSL